MTAAQSIWMPVSGFEGLYEVSNRGEVRSLDRVVMRNGCPVHRKGRMKRLSRKDHRHGHHVVKLTDRQGASRNRQVHQLVVEAFIGPRPDGMQVCHLNDDPTDNRVENLRYDSASANVADAIRNGRHFQASQTHCIHGHEFDGRNTWVSKTGVRHCRACARDRARARRAAKRALCDSGTV